MVLVERGQRLFIDITSINSGTAEGTAYIRVTIVGFATYDLLSITFGTKDGATNILSVGETDVTSLYV